MIAVACGAAAAALLAVTGCGPGTTTAPARTAAGATASSASSAASLRTGSCTSEGWAAAATDAGAVRWKARLPNLAAAFVGAAPLQVGGVAFFGYGNVLYALRARDGRQVWKRAFPAKGGSPTETVSGLWAWHGSLIVLAGPFGLGGTGGAADQLFALSPATGAVRWSLELTTQGLYGSVARTSNGVLVGITRPGALKAVDLSTGRLLWSRPLAPDQESDGPVASGTVIATAARGTVTGFDARTGRVLWTRHGLPSRVDVLGAPGGRVLVYDLFQQGKPFPVTALAAGSGRVLWRLATSGPVTAISVRHGWLAVGTSGTYRLSLVDPVSGHVRWSGATYVVNGMTWDITATDFVYVMSESYGAPHPGLTEVVDRRLPAGTVRWSVPLADWSTGTVLAPQGPNVLVLEPPGAGTSQMVLRAVDTATGTTKAAGPLSFFPRLTALSGGSALLETLPPACPSAAGPAATGQ